MTIPAELYPDNVNKPKHYRQGEIECIDAIKAQLTPEEYRGYLKGNIAKYVWRERRKGGTESLKKAQWYLERLISTDTKTGMDALCDRLQSHRTRQKEWHKGADDVTHLNPLEALKCRHSI